MSKFVKINDSDGNPFAHTFSVADWKKLITLKGKSNDKVQLSEGVASTDGKDVSVTLKSPGGSRIYMLPVNDLF